jgi:hypothetical protein
MTSKNNPKARENELVVQELRDEVLIYDLTIHKAYCLNPTSAEIWNLCDGNNSVSDITKQLSKKLKQPLTDDLVWLALDQFKEDNLLSHNQEVEIKFDGLSRREVIKKVGFASMVALPVIASLVAPTAAMAQSPGGGGGAPGQVESCDETAKGRDLNKTPNGGACKGNGNCCSNNCCATAGMNSGICQPATTVC